jgi:hypothetical protein
MIQGPSLVWHNEINTATFTFLSNQLLREWRRLHNEELHDLYSSPNIVQVMNLRRMRWAGHAACTGEMRGVYNILVGRPEGRRPLGRPRHRWEGNSKIDLQDVGWGGMDWTELA